MKPRAANDLYDLVVIGGGINGAAIARDAAMRGLSVALLEKHDFGYGASTKSSKLAHGGVRYLEQWQLGLVRESLQERALLMKNAPHLVHPLPFYYPVYASDARPLWQVNLGLYLYDFLGGGNDVLRHRKVGVDEIVRLFPGIRREGLQGGCLYYDAQMLDNRIVVENVVSAGRFGAEVFNYAEVTNVLISQGRVKGVCYRDPESQEIKTILCHSVVNATGAWSEQVAAMLPKGADESSCHLAPTKGVHIVVPKIADEAALVLHVPQDNRVFFVLPWDGNSLVGTTDTFYSGSPEDVCVDAQDGDYLLRALNSYFPDSQLDKSSILSSFAGLRPLVARSSQLALPSEIVREHFIETSSEGVTTILGGKFTTHRLMAEEVVDTVISHFPEKRSYRPCETMSAPLPGAQNLSSLAEIESKLLRAGVPAECVDHLLKTYGSESECIMKMISGDSSLAKRLCDVHPHVLAELDYVVNNEHVKRISDWFCRRSTIAFTPGCCGAKCLHTTAERLAVLLHWSQERKVREIEEYQEKYLK